MVADVYLKCCIWLRWETKCRKYESVLEWSLASFGRDSSVCQQFMKYCNSTIKISYTKILLKLQQIISTSRAQPGIREQILCCFKAFMWVLHRYLSSQKKKKEKNYPQNNKYCEKQVFYNTSVFILNGLPISEEPNRKLSFITSSVRVFQTRINSLSSDLHVIFNLWLQSRRFLTCFLQCRWLIVSCG